MSTCAMDGYLGAYVLDALEPDEQLAVQAHLSECVPCAAEAGSLASTASWLALLSEADAEHALGLDVEREAAGRSDRSRWMRRAALLVAAAAGVAAVGVASAAVAGEFGGPAEHRTTLQMADRGSAVSATLTVSPRSAATALHLSIRGVYPDGTCYLVVRGKDGRSATVARWVATARGSAEVDATTSIPSPDLAAFDVMAQSGHRLVHFVLPPFGN